MIKSPVIPTYLIVHIGEENDNGKNIRVPFIEYIKKRITNAVYREPSVLIVICAALDMAYTTQNGVKGIPVGC